MPETAQQYISRILGNLHDEDPMGVLESSPREISALINGKSESQLGRQPGPGKWSVGEIVAHLSEVELAVGYRIRMILGANGTPVQAFDQDAWAVRYAGMPIESSLETFRVLRAANVRLLRALTPAQWEQFGIHAERGRETVKHIARLNAGHDLNHLAQIKALL